MAAYDSLQYLSALQSIEIKAYIPNEDKLLEMVGGGTKTICWRAPGSHDLVIKDLTDDCKFCVGGAEIKNHPISVYYREGQTIGAIEDDLLTFVGRKAADEITKRPHGFTVAGNRIETLPTHIAISFHPSAGVEMKSIVIAFAIQRALAYRCLQQSLPIGSLNQQSLPIGSLNQQSLPIGSLNQQGASYSSIMPKQHDRQVGPVFTDEKSEQKFHLIMGGQSFGNRYLYIFFWMDDSKRKDILLTANVDTHKMVVFNTVGAIEYSVEVRPHSSISYVVSGSTTIGEIEIHKRGKVSLSTTNGPSSKNTMHFEGRFHDGKIVDLAGVQLATFIKSGHSSRAITFLRMTANEKKVVSAYLIQSMYRLLPLSRNTAQVALTMLTCNCRTCQEPQPIGPLDRNSFIYTFNSIKDLAVAVVGHNSSKNLVYYNVFDEATKLNQLTLECTPLEKFQGFVKLVVKEAYGRIIFQAVALPDDVLAIYSHEDKLLAYHHKEHVFDYRDNLIMTINKQVNITHSVSMGGTDRMYEHAMFDSQTKEKIAILRSQVIGMHFRQIGLVKMGRLPHTAVGLALAVKQYCDTYHFDKILSPEISYRYKGSTADAKHICFV